MHTRSELSLFAATVGGNVLMQAEGSLDARTYLPLRDAVVKAALEQPEGVIVDVSRLSVDDSSAWTVFISVRRQLPDGVTVPLALVCENRCNADAIARLGISRAVPLYSTFEHASAALAGRRAGRRD